MKKFITLILFVFLTACSTTKQLENTFTFNEEIDGMGAWDWKGFETSTADSQVWRQIDNYFSFSYPAKWELKETLNEIVVSDGNFKLEFLVSQPKEEADLKNVKDYCLNQINGSDQVIVEEGDLILGGKDAYSISFDNTSGKEYSGYLICINMNGSWMWIKASPLDESYEAKFENILGSLSFTEEIDL